MAFSSSAMVVVVVMNMLCILVTGGEAATDCTTTLAGLEGCAAFLTNSSTTPDQKTCCDPLQTVLTTPSSFQCICAEATGSQSTTFKNALLLPKACKLDINVSAANCTSTTPAATPASSKTNTTGTGSGGFVSASPYSPLIALALLYAIASLSI